MKRRTNELHKYKHTLIYRHTHPSQTTAHFTNNGRYAIFALWIAQMPLYIHIPNILLKHYAPPQALMLNNLEIASIFHQTYQHIYIQCACLSAWRGQCLHLYYSMRRTEKCTLSHLPLTYNSLYPLQCTLAVFECVLFVLIYQHPNSFLWSWWLGSLMDGNAATDCKEHRWTNLAILIVKHVVLQLPFALLLE